MPCHRSPKSFNTDVGVSLTLFQADPTDRVIVLEMGTNAPGEIAELTQIAEPDLGVITNIGETHLEGLGSVEGVAKAKAELLDALGRDSAAFLNADDPWFEFLAKRVQGKVISYGTRREAAFRGHNVQTFEGGHSFLIRGGIRVELSVPGRHNVLNALAALAVADYLGLSLSDAAARMATFRLPEMRYQVEQIRGITVVFDGYNANPGSMQRGDCGVQQDRGARPARRRARRHDGARPAERAAPPGAGRGSRAFRRQRALGGRQVRPARRALRRGKRSRRPRIAGGGGGAGRRATSANTCNPATPCSSKARAG